MSASDVPDYAGDLSAEDAYAFLQGRPDAVLVDVRTRAEWSFVGVPDLSAVGKQPLLIEWQSFPAMQVDPAFAEKLEAELSARGAPADAPLLFLCRSGGRSRAAAISAALGGRHACYNIADGFEGPRDSDGHRGTLAGWKAAKLPWSQT